MNTSGIRERAGRLGVLLCLGGVAFGRLTAQGTDTEALRETWARAVVGVEITTKAYDIFRPWTRGVGSARGSGVVIGEREILMAAETLKDNTLLRLQKAGRGQWWVGSVTWVDFHSNVALVTCDDPAFWEGLRPVGFAEPEGRPADLQVVRWREGKLENRRAEFNQYAVRPGQMSVVHHVHLEATTELEGGGWSEPVFAGERLAGVAAAQDGRDLTVLPSRYLETIVRAAREGTFGGVSYFGFTWQPALNPALPASLGLVGEPRGVVVIKVPEAERSPDGVRPKDILLTVDGFPIDIQGDYRDPDYGYLMLENLAARDKWAGETVRLEVWRDGDVVLIDYVLPGIGQAEKLVPGRTYGRDPEYLIAGGLVFQPLDTTFLEGWGENWETRAPFLLGYYRFKDPTEDHPTRVLLSGVLPDPVNLGYEGYRFLVVDRINGRPVARLSDVGTAFSEAEDGVHVIEFEKGDSLRRMVLDAGGLAGATQRVLARYGIDRAAVIHDGEE